MTSRLSKLLGRLPGGGQSENRSPSPQAGTPVQNGTPGANTTPSQLSTTPNKSRPTLLATGTTPEEVLRERRRAMSESEPFTNSSPRTIPSTASLRRFDLCEDEDNLALAKMINSSSSSSSSASSVLGSSHSEEGDKSSPSSSPARNDAEPILLLGETDEDLNEREAQQAYPEVTERVVNDEFPSSSSTTSSRSSSVSSENDIVGDSVRNRSQKTNQIMAHVDPTDLQQPTTSNNNIKSADPISTPSSAAPPLGTSSRSPIANKRLPNPQNTNNNNNSINNNPTGTTIAAVGGVGGSPSSEIFPSASSTAPTAILTGHARRRTNTNTSRDQHPLSFSETPSFTSTSATAAMHVTVGSGDSSRVPSSSSTPTPSPGASIPHSRTNSFMLTAVNNGNKNSTSPPSAFAGSSEPNPVPAPTSALVGEGGGVRSTNIVVPVTVSGHHTPSSEEEVQQTVSVGGHPSLSLSHGTHTGTCSRGLSPSAASQNGGLAQRGATGFRSIKRPVSPFGGSGNTGSNQSPTPSTPTPPTSQPPYQHTRNGSADAGGGGGAVSGQAPPPPLSKISPLRATSPWSRIAGASGSQAVQRQGTPPSRGGDHHQQRLRMSQAAGGGGISSTDTASNNKAVLGEATRAAASVFRVNSVSPSRPYLHPSLTRVNSSPSPSALLAAGVGVANPPSGVTIISSESSAFANPAATTPSAADHRAEANGRGGERINNSKAEEATGHSSFTGNSDKNTTTTTANTASTGMSNRHNHDDEELTSEDARTADRKILSYSPVPPALSGRSSSVATNATTNTNTCTPVNDGTAARSKNICQGARGAASESDDGSQNPFSNFVSSATDVIYSEFCENIALIPRLYREEQLLAETMEGEKDESEANHVETKMTKMTTTATEDGGCSAAKEHESDAYSPHYPNSENRGPASFIDLPLVPPQPANLPVDGAQSQDPLHQTKFSGSPPLPSVSPAGGVTVLFSSPFGYDELAIPNQLSTTNSTAIEFDNNKINTGNNANGLDKSLNIVHSDDDSSNEEASKNNTRSPSEAEEAEATAFLRRPLSDYCRMHLTNRSNRCVENTAYLRLFDNDVDENDNEEEIATGSRSKKSDELSRKDKENAGKKERPQSRGEGEAPDKDEEEEVVADGSVCMVSTFGLHQHYHHKALPPSTSAAAGSQNSRTPVRTPNTGALLEEEPEEQNKNQQKSPTRAGPSILLSCGGSGDVKNDDDDDDKYIDTKGDGDGDVRGHEADGQEEDDQEGDFEGIPEGLLATEGTGLSASFSLAPSNVTTPADQDKVKNQQRSNTSSPPPPPLASNTSAHSHGSNGATESDGSTSNESNFQAPAVDQDPPRPAVITCIDLTAYHGTMCLIIGDTNGRVDLFEAREPRSVLPCVGALFNDCSSSHHHAADGKRGGANAGISARSLIKGLSMTKGGPNAAGGSSGGGGLRSSLRLGLSSKSVGVMYSAHTLNHDGDLPSPSNSGVPTECEAKGPQKEPIAITNNEGRTPPLAADDVAPLPSSASLSSNGNTVKLDSTLCPASNQSNTNRSDENSKGNDGDHGNTAQGITFHSRGVSLDSNGNTKGSAAIMHGFSSRHGHQRSGSVSPFPPRTNTGTPFRSSGASYSARPTKFTKKCSHQAFVEEFDCRKSNTIDHQLRCVRFLPPNRSPGVTSYLAANEKTIKLFRIRDEPFSHASSSYHSSLIHVKRRNSTLPKMGGGLGNRRVRGGAAADGGGEGGGNSPGGSSLISGAASDGGIFANNGDYFPVTPRQRFNKRIVMPVKAFTNAHQYSIQSISLSADSETFLSLDDLQVYWWHLEAQDTTKATKLADLKPESGQPDILLTAAAFHPQNGSLFLVSNSNGVCDIGDLRDPPCRKRREYQISLQIKPSLHNAVYHADHNDILSAISSASFMGKDYVVTRDYLSVKLWDLRYPTNPVAACPVMDFLAPTMDFLYDKDYIFDRFPLAVDDQSLTITTGLYAGTVAVWRPGRDSARDHANVGLRAGQYGGPLGDLYRYSFDEVEFYSASDSVKIPDEYGLNEQLAIGQTSLDHIISRIVVDSASDDEEYMTELKEKEERRARAKAEAKARRGANVSSDPYSSPLDYSDEDDQHDDDEEEEEEERCYPRVRRQAQSNRVTNVGISPGGDRIAFTTNDHLYTFTRR